MKECSCSLFGVTILATVEFRLLYTTCWTGLFVSSIDHYGC